MNVGGALPPARGDLDDLVTSLVHDGARWAAPRTARRAVFGLGVARRATWFRHAAPIVTRGRHAFTEARKSTRIVAGAARRRFAAAITPSLVSGTPPPSIPCGVSSDLTRPSLSRRCASFASRRVRVGPLGCPPVCVLICLI